MSTSQEEVLRTALQYQAALTGYAYGLLRDWGQAEDVAQESMLVAQKKWEDFEPGTSMMAWLRQIARYKCLDALRAGKRTILTGDEELIQLVDAAFERYTDEEAAEGLLDMRDALGACMEGLNEKSRGLLVRFYRDGWPMKKLSAWAGRSANALRVNLSRIRKNLRRCIERRLSIEECQE